MPQEIVSLKSAAETIWPHPAWDLLLIFSLFASAFFYGIFAGKRKIAANIIYVYAAFVAAEALPFRKIAAFFELKSDFFLGAAFFLLIFFCLSRFLGSRFRFGAGESSGWLPVFVLSFLQMGLLVHLALRFLPPEKTALLSAFVKYVFVNPSLRVWWLVVPLATIILLRRLERE